MSRTRRHGGLWRASLLVVLLMAWIAAPAQAVEFGITDFDGAFLEENGAVASQAGSHPASAGAYVSFTSQPDALMGAQVPPVNLRRIAVELPPGLVGDPTAIPRCTLDELNEGTNVPQCPLNSQVGVLALSGGLFGDTPQMPSWGPLYNVTPPPGTAAAFGTTVAGIAVMMVAEVGVDGSVTLVADDISEAVAVVMTGAKFWGVPAHPRHDIARQGKGVLPACLLFNGNGYPDEIAAATTGCNVAAGLPLKPFITMPTSCTPAGTGLETRTSVVSWRGDTDSASFFSHFPAPDEGTQVGITGCEELRFDPSISVVPTSTVPDAPTGLDVELSVPQDKNSDGLAQSHLRDAVVTLPEGMAISPSSADGLAACADDQLRLDSTVPARCPAGSKIGTVEVETPLLEERLEGSVFVRTQNSRDPASGQMFRLAIEIRNDDRGIDVKLAGEVSADPRTGRLTATFADAPQMPFSVFRLHFKGGPRAPLANPPTCGTKTVEAEFTPWSGNPPVQIADSFTLDCPGAGGFAPVFEAGSVNPTGGAFSPFVARVERPSGQEILSGVSVDMPAGMLAKLRGVERCPDALAAEGTLGRCPAGSRIGSTVVGAGTGSPFHLSGDVYLTGPHRGAPFGLSVQVPAKAGPYDLGVVKVRQALLVDRSTAEVSVVSDPLPQIVGGVPVRLRSVDVDVDRQGFAINPSSCAQKRVEATLTSAGGAVHQTASRFQLGDCRALAFRPRLSLGLTGRRQVTTGRHPGVRARVTQPGLGAAGIARARVVLPRALALDPENAQALCEFEDGTNPDLENRCPRGSIVGQATARTPLLDKPLTGDVYFVKNVERNPRTSALIRKLPMIVLALRGEIAINLVGKASTTPDGRLVSTFNQVPDAPINRFDLTIDGGANGILAITRTRQSKINLCARPNSHTATTEMDGHNGKRADYRTTVKTPCARKAIGSKGRKARSTR